MQLITLGALKSYLELVNTDHDTLLTSIIAFTSKRFETYCNREFKKELRSKYFDVDNCIETKKYFLPCYPIDSTTFTATYNTTVMTKDSDYYIWEESGIVEFYYTLTYSHPKQLKIDYYGGYQESNSIIEVPDDLQYACILQCAFIYRRRKDIGLQSVNLPDGSLNVMAPNDLLPDVKQILNTYKNYIF